MVQNALSYLALHSRVYNIQDGGGKMKKSRVDDSAEIFIK